MDRYGFSGYGPDFTPPNRRTTFATRQSGEPSYMFDPRRGTWVSSDPDIYTNPFDTGFRRGAYRGGRGGAYGPLVRRPRRDVDGDFGGAEAEPFGEVPQGRRGAARPRAGGDPVVPGTTPAAGPSETAEVKQPVEKQDKKPWEVLGVSKDASPEEIDKAFKTLQRKHHPDRVKDRSPEEIKKQTELFAEIGRAKDEMDMEPKIQALMARMRKAMQENGAIYGSRRMALEFFVAEEGGGLDPYEEEGKVFKRAEARIIEEEGWDPANFDDGGDDGHDDEGDEDGGFGSGWARGRGRGWNSSRASRGGGHAGHTGRAASGMDGRTSRSSRQSHPAHPHGEHPHRPHRPEESFGRGFGGRGFAGSGFEPGRGHSTASARGHGMHPSRGYGSHSDSAFNPGLHRGSHRGFHQGTRTGTTCPTGPGCPVHDPNTRGSYFPYMPGCPHARY